MADEMRCEFCFLPFETSLCIADEDLLKNSTAKRAKVDVSPATELVLADISVTINACSLEAIALRSVNLDQVAVHAGKIAQSKAVLDDVHLATTLKMEANLLALEKAFASGLALLEDAFLRLEENPMDPGAIRAWEEAKGAVPPLNPPLAVFDAAVTMSAALSASHRGRRLPDAGKSSVGGRGSRVFAVRTRNMVEVGCRDFEGELVLGILAEEVSASVVADTGDEAEVFVEAGEPGHVLIVYQFLQGSFLSARLTVHVRGVAIVVNRELEMGCLFAGEPRQRIVVHSGGARQCIVDALRDLVCLNRMGSKELWVFRASSGELLGSIPFAEEEALDDAKGPLWQFCWTCDGSIAVFGSFTGKVYEVKVWEDSELGLQHELVWECLAGTTCMPVSIDSAGEHIVIGDATYDTGFRHACQVLQRGTQVLTPLRPLDWEFTFGGAKLFDDGTGMCVGISDLNKGSVEIWSLGTGTNLRSVQVGLCGMYWSGASATLQFGFSSADRGLVVFDVFRHHCIVFSISTGAEIRRFSVPPEGATEMLIGGDGFYFPCRDVLSRMTGVIHSFT